MNGLKYVIEYSIIGLTLLVALISVLKYFAHFKVPKVCENKFANFGIRLDKIEKKLKDVRTDTDKLITRNAVTESRLELIINDLKQVAADLKEITGFIAYNNKRRKPYYQKRR